MKLRTKSVKLYTTSDGRDYEDKNEAMAHEAGLNLVRFLSCAVSEADGYVILRAIQADINGFREVIGPLMRRPRGKSAKIGLDLNQVEPLREGETTFGAEPQELVYAPLDEMAEAQTGQPPKKRRGRPPGSKNRQKAAANSGEEAHPTT